MGGVLYLKSAIREKNRAQLSKRLDSHPIRTIEFWEEYKLEGKAVREANEYVLDYINLDNKLYGIKSVVAPSGDPKIIEVVDSVFENLPKTLHQLYSFKLLGVFPVTGLGTTGYTEIVYDKMGKVAGAFIIVDMNYLKDPLDTWFSKREAMPFKPGELALSVRFTSETEKTSSKTLEYILVHELAHVISANWKHHPHWNAKTINDISDYKYMSLSWKTDLSRKKYVPKLKPLLPYYGKLSFYKEPELPNSSMLGFFQTLAQSNFPTPYSVSSFSEDFADSFASYYFCIKNRVCPEYVVKKRDQELSRTKSCWETENCEEKKQYFDLLFSSDPMLGY
ncbi:MAG: hypothetical protein CL677_05030 [Bdellovibrionaceae bacterium]|nr:hypothetical protein [Pseudobdellovibrionaceae bacterium]